MSVGVMTVRVMSVREITVGSCDCRSNEMTPSKLGSVGWDFFFSHLQVWHEHGDEGVLLFPYIYFFV